MPSGGWPWAAGLFEGEGCITTNRRKPKLQLQMTDEDIVRRFAAVVGVGYVSGPFPRAHPRKPVYQWAVYRFDEFEYVIGGLWPWLGQRRKARCTEVVKNYLPHARELKGSEMKAKRKCKDKSCNGAVWL